jgi:hypothetical protein
MQAFIEPLLQPPGIFFQLLRPGNAAEVKSKFANE